MRCRLSWGDVATCNRSICRSSIGACSRLDIRIITYYRYVHIVFQQKVSDLFLPSVAMISNFKQSLMYSFLLFFTYAGVIYFKSLRINELEGIINNITVTIPFLWCAEKL